VQWPWSRPSVQHLCGPLHKTTEMAQCTQRTQIGTNTHSLKKLGVASTSSVVAQTHAHVHAHTHIQNVHAMQRWQFNRTQGRNEEDECGGSSYSMTSLPLHCTSSRHKHCHNVFRLERETNKPLLYIV